VLVMNVRWDADGERILRGSAGGHRSVDAPDRSLSFLGESRGTQQIMARSPDGLTGDRSALDSSVATSLTNAVRGRRQEHLTWRHASRTRHTNLASSVQ
jgi:hypothetical protein